MVYSAACASVGWWLLGAGAVSSVSWSAVVRGWGLGRFQVDVYFEF